MSYVSAQEIKALAPETPCKMPRTKREAARQYKDIRRRFGFEVPPQLNSHLNSVRNTFFDVVD
jgi:hypothetical protein